MFAAVSLLLPLIAAHYWIEDVPMVWLLLMVVLGLIFVQAWHHLTWEVRLIKLTGRILADRNP